MSRIHWPLVLLYHHVSLRISNVLHVADLLLLPTYTYYYELVFEHLCASAQRNGVSIRADDAVTVQKSLCSLSCNPQH